MLLQRTKYFIKEHVGFVKLTDNYDILDPDTQQPLGIAREEPAAWAKYLRLLVNKSLLPTTINVYDDAGQLVFSIKRPVSFFRSKVNVLDATGQPMGYFKSKVFTLGGGFYVFDIANNQIAEVKGDWKGWNFELIGANGTQLGVVTKKWAGLAKEFFTSADNYLISLEDGAAGNEVAAAMLLAAGLAVDVVYKEKES